MIDLTRRKFLIAAAGLIAAPAIVKASSLMKVKALDPALLRTVREVRIRAIKRHLERYAAIEDSVFLGDVDLSLPAVPMPKISATVEGFPILDISRRHLAGPPAGWNDLPGDEVIEFSTPDKPFYWGSFGRGTGIVGAIIHVGHPSIEGGEYRVISIESLDDGDRVQVLS